MADVFVLPAHRGRGLARFLVTTLLEHPRLARVEQWLLARVERWLLARVERWLLATNDAHGVGAPVGFTPLPDPGQFMVRASRR